MYKNKSNLSEQDSLSKVILVYLSVIQFIDLATDAKLLYDMYRYSRIKYMPCNPSRIDYLGANQTMPGEPECSIIAETEENVDFFIKTNGTLSLNPEKNLSEKYVLYSDDNEFSYKVSTVVMLISMMSTYLVAYSSIIKLMLDNGSYEEHVIKKNAIIAIFFKIIFLSFMGPIYIMGIEMFSTFMAISQMYALLAIGYQGFDLMKDRFMYIFENILKLDEERAEGLKQQRTIAQLFFENIPMLIIQTLIQFNVLQCEQL